MYKYNLKANPELARERHNKQSLAWYYRNKEYVMDMQRERRLTKRLMKQYLVAQETHPMPDEKEFERLRELLKKVTTKNKE